MSNNEKEISKPLKNWKVRAELLRQINIECATHGLMQAELAERCWKAYLKTGGILGQNAKQQINREHNDIRKYFHWLIDHLLDAKNPQFEAIDANLTLVAYALYHAGSHPIQDMRAFLHTLFESEMSAKEPSPPEPSRGPKSKKSTKR